MAAPAFSIEIKNLDETLKRFDRYGEKAETAVWYGILRTAVEVLDHARANVHKITSTLARSISITDQNQKDLSVTISTNVEYAAVEEFGYQGIQIVSAHTRTIKQAFGQPIPLTVVQVSPHTRFIDRPPHPYMGPAAEYGQQRIGPNVEAELNALEL